MSNWKDYGGGYMTENDATTPTQAKKARSRKQFFCPVAVRQLLEASHDTLRSPSISAVVVSLLGIVTDIEISVTNVTFNLSDDTGRVECTEWLEIEDCGKAKPPCELRENTYYHVFGCIKYRGGSPRIMVFKVRPVKNFNEVTIFMLEVARIYRYFKGDLKAVKEPVNNKNLSEAELFEMSYEYRLAAFTPAQRAVFDAVKNIGTQVGWSKHDPDLRKTFSARQIQEAVDFLVSEGHIYSTVDDSHYSCT